MNLLNKQICVKLNSLWQAVGTCTVGKAVTMLCTEEGGEDRGYAMDYETVFDDAGNAILKYAMPVSWDDWMKLPVRDTDLYINTSRGKIRAPLVVMCAEYSELPVKKKRFSNGNVWERDGGICQYTGEKVNRNTGNIDHVIPRDRGGKDEWTNVVVARKDINSRKSNRLNSEAGLKLIKKPQAPKAVVTIMKKADAPLPEQAAFLQ